MQLKQTKKREACINYKIGLKLKVFTALKDNMNSRKNSRKQSRGKKLLVENGGFIERTHFDIMRRINFWAIFPIEGKYEMAA